MRPRLRAGLPLPHTGERVVRRGQGTGLSWVKPLSPRTEPGEKPEPLCSPSPCTPLSVRV